MSRAVSVALLCLMTASPSLAQQLNNHDDPRGTELNYFKRAHPDRVALLTAAGSGIEIRHVVIHMRGRLLEVGTAAGVATRNENRVRLSSVPVLGGLFEDRFGREDIALRNRIGTVYRRGDTLDVDVADDQPMHPITRVAILNQDNAYFLEGTPRPVPATPASGRERVGQAFIKNGEGLLLLIEPSVIERSIF